MRVFKKNGITIYFLVLALHCVFVYLDIPVARAISKALLLPCLFLYAWANAGSSMSKLAYAGLVFSFLGDVLLLGAGDLYFLCGMLAFVGTHCCNGIYFLRQTDHANTRLTEALITAVILIVLSISVLALLNDRLGAFRIPVLVYMLVISIMAILAAHTAGDPGLRKIAWNSFIPGAGLFVISDTILALNKFLFHEPLVDLPVITSYGLAEFFLVKGFIALNKDPSFSFTGVAAR